MIRDYKDTDAETLSIYLEDISKGENYPPTDKRGKELAEWFRDQDFLFRMVYVDENDTPLGHVAVRVNFPKEGNTGLFLYDNPSNTGYPWFEMTKLFTSPEAQGEGIGSTLMYAAVEGIHNLEGAPCLIVNADSAVVSFYLSHGWSSIGVFNAASDGRSLLAMELSLGYPI